jgi:16S rRNA (cytosine967-C5)-methyltransferase
VKVEAADGAAWRAVQKVDFILLDAPCSATGTVRRHPDVLHLKTEKDIARLADTQNTINSIDIFSFFINKSIYFYKNYT